MRVVAMIWLAALIVGILTAWAVRAFFYDENDDGGSTIDAAQAAEISTARAATALAEAGTVVVIPNSPSVLPTNTAAPTATAQPAVELTGSGTGPTAEFDLQRGFNVITTTHTGAGQFRVNLVNASGETLSPAAAGSGDWQGSRSVIILEDGPFHFEVTAEGDWSLAIQRVDPTPTTIRDLPAEVTGSHYQTLYFFRVEPGPYTIEISCQSGPIRMSVTDNNFGNRRIYHEGECPDTATIAMTATRAPFDTIAIDITSTAGEWTVTVRQ